MRCNKYKMSVPKISTILFILPLTTKVFVQCEEIASKITTKSIVTPYKTSTKLPTKSPKLSTIGNILRQEHSYTWPAKTKKFNGRTAPFRDTLPDQCDFIIKYCHKTYATSAICARTLYYEYQTFKNYCMLDFVNCREGHEIWQILHMGKCYTLEEASPAEFIYSGDTFLSNDYVVDRHTFKLHEMPRYIQEREQ
ncbi:uncharacterized protein LOC111362758 [Spodoptera litura]|uniref:Uncharacterized protein LOC111362758 n=1 Tax=Spodoptera litura TaxID=69820 RepID=A0A9J7EUI3_SPOLT|nr:uncharacterized protein LOC111362758 [Spodoptera litura]